MPEICKITRVYQMAIPHRLRCSRCRAMGSCWCSCRSGYWYRWRCKTHWETPRDVFVALFFVSLGTLIDPKVLLNNLPLLGWMLLLIVAGKFLVWTTVVWLFRYPLRTGIAVAAGLTQIGELSFVVVQVARSSELVTEKVFSAVIAASLISILLNVFLVRGVFAWIGKEPPKQARTDFAERSAHGDPRGEMAAQQASLA